MTDTTPTTPETFSPTDLSKHVRAKHITALVTGQKPVVTDEDASLKARHTELLIDKGTDPAKMDEHELLVAIYTALGGGVSGGESTTAAASPTAKPKRVRAKKNTAAPTAPGAAVPPAPEAGTAPTV